MKAHAALVKLIGSIRLDAAREQMLLDIAATPQHFLFEPIAADTT